MNSVLSFLTLFSSPDFPRLGRISGMSLSAMPSLGRSGLTDRCWAGWACASPGFLRSAVRLLTALRVALILLSMELQGTGHMVVCTINLRLPGPYGPRRGWFPIHCGKVLREVQVSRRHAHLQGVGI